MPRVMVLLNLAKDNWIPPIA